MGQSFLQDRSFLAKIVAAAEIAPGDRLLEVGAGTGVLTAALADAAGEVTAIELDDSLYLLLQREFAARENVTLLHANALSVDPCQIFDGPYKLIANIPYYITGVLLRHFLEAVCQPELLVLMVQREVAQRMAARPGELSLLGVSVQFYARVDIVTKVPAGAFFPRPKVDSAIVRLTPHRRYTADPTQEAFFEVARAGFGLRRKQLVNALSHGLQLHREATLELLGSAGIVAERRAETLTVSEWEALAAWWGAKRPRGTT